MVSVLPITTRLAPTHQLVRALRRDTVGSPVMDLLARPLQAQRLADPIAKAVIS